jgi:RNA polymerase sigma-70 factor (ECF subfamily)
MSSFFNIELPPDAIARARDGNPEAAKSLYLAFERPVRTLARRLVPRRGTAEDLVQDVFVEVLTSLRQFDGRGSFAGWVRAITVRKCLMHLRSPWQRGLRWLESAVADAEPDEPPDHREAREGEQIDLERALAQLPEAARLVVWLHDVEGYTHAEIGSLLGGTASLSKSQLSRAHARLRTLLEPDRVESPCMHVSTSC